jgi:hypothetical protein
LRKRSRSPSRDDERDDKRTRRRWDDNNNSVSLCWELLHYIMLLFIICFGFYYVF